MTLMAEGPNSQEQGAVAGDSMVAKRQKVGSYRQLNMFEVLIARGHGTSGKGGTEAGASVEQQTTTALNEGRSLAQNRDRYLELKSYGNRRGTEQVCPVV